MVVVSQISMALFAIVDQETEDLLCTFDVPLGEAFGRPSAHISSDLLPNVLSQLMVREGEGRIISESYSNVLRRSETLPGHRWNYG